MTYDVVVVLGAALGPDGDLGPALAERVLVGVEAWRRGLAPMLIVTGALEAELMKRRAVKLGVPAEQVLLEPTALTTRDNAVRCAAIMRAHGMTRALLITQSYHRARAVAAFRNVGVEAEAYEFVGPTRLKWHLREWVARAVYRARGWI
jgi:uncharacterized SAM-binding protein YcdF (DUF218 family)